MRITLRVVSLVTSVLALYMVLAPALSALPNRQPLWLQTGFWSAAILLILSAFGTGSSGGRLALLGSSLVIAVYCCAALTLFLARIGYLHFRTRLVAAPEFPRWRLTLDKPVLFLLLFFALATLGLALQSRYQARVYP